jgi:hypothetical protein
MEHVFYLCPNKRRGENENEIVLLDDEFEFKYLNDLKAKMQKPCRICNHVLVCWPPNRHKIDNKTRFQLGTKFPGYSFNELGKEGNQKQNCERRANNGRWY